MLLETVFLKIFYFERHPLEAEVLVLSEAFVQIPLRKISVFVEQKMKDFHHG